MDAKRQSGLCESCRIHIKKMQSTLNTKNPVDSNVFPSVVVPKSQSGQVESGDLDCFAICCPAII